MCLVSSENKNMSNWYFNIFIVINFVTFPKSHLRSFDS